MTEFFPVLDRVPTALRYEAACAQYLAATRWPDGFVCLGCGGGKAWTYEWATAVARALNIAVDPSYGTRGLRSLRVRLMIVAFLDLGRSVFSRASQRARGLSQFKITSSGSDRKMAAIVA